MKVVTSRSDKDCGVCALASWTTATYEDALIALGGEAPAVLREGVSLLVMRRAAGVLGYIVHVKRRVDLETAAGILWLTSKPKGVKHDHVVSLVRNQIIDSDGEVFHPAASYLVEKGWTIRRLLILDDGE